MVFVKGAKSLAFATALSPLTGCAIGLGLMFAGLVRAEAYAPEIGQLLFGRVMLGFALIETFMVVVLAIIALIFVY